MLDVDVSLVKEVDIIDECVRVLQRLCSAF